MLKRLNAGAAEAPPPSSTRQSEQGHYRDRTPTVPCSEELEAELLEELGREVDLPVLAKPKPGRRAEFVPAHWVRGASGKPTPSPAAEPSLSIPTKPESVEQDPILIVRHSQDPLDALLESVPPEPLADAEEELEEMQVVEQEETIPCMRVRLAPRRRSRRALSIVALGLSLALLLFATRSLYPGESGQPWRASLSVVQQTLFGYLEQ